MPRSSAHAGLVVLLMLAACTQAPAGPPAIDLVAELPAAERRAAGNVDEAVRVASVDGGDGAAAALLLRAPARVIWTLHVPDDATLSASAAVVPGSGAGATLRIGISDDRYYEGLLTLPLPDTGGASWQPVAIDLRKYAGWQWSLFYRPSERVWKLIVNADATPGGTLALRAPRISGAR